MKRHLGLFAMTIACATATSDKPAATAPENDAEMERMQGRIDALEGRVDALERAGSSNGTATPGASWSCQAKCGVRSTQTTEFHVTFDEVTGQGSTAAAAYEDMRRKCDGRLYERLEDERFIGGDMKSTCMRDGG